MKIQFCGAAQTVTGSQHLLSINGKNVLLDCGLYQGRRQETYERNVRFLYDPSRVDAVILSHAHMDHCGNLPNLVKQGFRGPIHATPVTIELARILLKDSAFLQAHDILWVNKIRKKDGLPPALPLYTPEEAAAVMSLFVPQDYDRSFSVVPGLDATFTEAGHILGAAGVLLEANDRGRKLRVGFSGDVGRFNMPIIRDPVRIDDLDALIMESTYGSRLHPPIGEVEEELSGIIREALSQGGKILIPAFAVGRTQIMIYLLHKLFNQDRIPEVPVFVDSPLAVAATDIYRNNPDILDRETARIFLNNGEDPFSFRRLNYVTDVEESKRLNVMSYPHIVISSSGMCEGGRILHHLRNSIDNPKTTLLFIGYAAKHTLARKIMDGERNVKIFGEPFRVNCRVRVMDHFSAHGDRRDILDYIRATPPTRLKQIFLVHGEPEESLSLIDAIRSQGYPSVLYPEPGAHHEI